jgi:hypothetical protein
MYDDTVEIIAVTEMEEVIVSAYFKSKTQATHQRFLYLLKV